jgi:ATP-dependent Clp protease ATP-binding subunit ClpX
VPPKGGRKHPQQEFLQVDTTNILFICGGAFVGLEDIIEQRVGQSRSASAPRFSSKKDARVGPAARGSAEDLLKYGMIPEFVGRLPGHRAAARAGRGGAHRHPDQAKNALVRQYQKLFEMDGVKLRFTKGALQAGRAGRQKHKSGARGLRAILEQAMLDIMFEVPPPGPDPRGRDQRGDHPEGSAADSHVPEGRRRSGGGSVPKHAGGFTVMQVTLVAPAPFAWAQG